jgi:SAM-dependent methyltransferase
MELLKRSTRINADSALHRNHSNATWSVVLKKNGIKVDRSPALLSEPLAPNSFLTRIANETPSHRFLAHSTQAVYRRQVRYLSNLLNGRLDRSRKSIKVLDWGCGKGHITYLLLEEGLDVTSCDVDNSAADSTFGQETPILKRLEKTVIPLRDPISLPFETASFDCVTSFGVLEHVSTDIGSLKEVRRVLRPGGLFFVTFLPFRFSWTQALARLRGNSYHDRLYSIRQVAELAQATGFKLESIWLAQLFPKNSVPYFLDKYLEPCDRWICRNTPLKYLATNLEIVMSAVETP